MSAVGNIFWGMNHFCDEILSLGFASWHFFYSVAIGYRRDTSVVPIG